MTLAELIAKARVKHGEFLRSVGADPDTFGYDFYPEAEDPLTTFFREQIRLHKEWAANQYKARKSVMMVSHYAEQRPMLRTKVEA